MLPNVGWPELIVIMVIALLLFGPERMAGVGGAVGQAIREFRKTLREDEGGRAPGDDNGRPRT
jgi:sec-independent protein translocase protein TatA